MNQPMSHDQETYRRATSAALAALCVQIGLTIAVAIVGLWAKSPAMHAATWHLLGGWPVWVVLLILFHQQRLEHVESLEFEDREKSDAASALFEDSDLDLRMARRRLLNLRKWGLGLVSVIMGLYLLVAGGILLLTNLRAMESNTPGDVAFYSEALGSHVNTLVLMAIWIAIALAAFLMARYIAGMTRVAAWQLLRGGAAYLMGNATIALLIVAGAVAAHLHVANFMATLRIIVPAVMLLLGLEILITFLLAAYRPRRADEVPRPAFDSRILGLLTTPQSITRAIGEAINYQFGFEVSRSWFYRLLGRAMAPLAVLLIVILFLISSVVIVDTHEGAIVTRFGRITGKLEPGLHFKMPWPISTTKKVAVHHLHTLAVGSMEKEVQPGMPVLWTNEHAGSEESYLVTAPNSLPSASTADAENPTSDEGTHGMSLVAAQIVVNYRIDDLERYITYAADPTALLKAMCQRYVNAHFVKNDIDTLLRRYDPENTNAKTLGQALCHIMGEDEDVKKMGVQITSVLVPGIHPPQASDVALSFHEQIGAEQEAYSALEKAEQQRIEILAKVAGSETYATRLFEAITDYNHTRTATESDAATMREKQEEIDRLLATAGGEVADKINAARAHRWKEALAVRTRAERFKTDVLAFEAAPSYYRVRRYLNIVANGMADARKILIPTHLESTPRIRLDLTEDRTDFSGVLTDDDP